MAKYLDDGTVVPSFLSVGTYGSSSASVRFSSGGLIVGEVKTIIYPSEDKSYSKKYIEYTVDAQRRSGGGAATTVTYTHCYVMNSFGGVADYSKHTLRSDPTAQSKGKNFGVGSKVLMMCIDGESTQAYIIGGVREDTVADTTDDGHNLKFEFNGLNASINNAGEFTVKFRGATNADGKPAKGAVKEAEGTSLKFDKDGNFIAATPDSKQFIKLNHKDGKIEAKADQLTHLDCNGDVQIKSTGLKLGDANEAFVKGTTFRKNQTIMDNQLNAQFKVLQSLLITAGAALTTASALHAVPISGPIAGASFIATAATSLNAAAGICNTISTAFQTFEQSTNDYLSRKNLGD